MLNEVIAYKYLIILTNPSARQDMDTRSIFKRSLTGLNSEFSFSETSCLTKAVEPSLSYYFTHSWRENYWIHTFPKGISAMLNAISLVLLTGPNQFFRLNFKKYFHIFFYWSWWGTWLKEYSFSIVFQISKKCLVQHVYLNLGENLISISLYWFLELFCCIVLKSELCYVPFS